MIPYIPELETSVGEANRSTLDFAINISSDKMSGMVDGLEAVKQVAYLILNTERFDHIIYSWNYGVELRNLINQPRSYVIPEIKRRIEEALKQDDRILGVDDFKIDFGKRHIHVDFKVISKYGSFEQSLEVTN